MAEKVIRVTSVELPELAVYASLKEPQLLHYFEPELGIFVCETAQVIRRALAAGYEPLSFLMETKELEGEGKALADGWTGIPVYTAEKEVLSQITGYKLARGVLSVMRRKPLPPPEVILAGKKRVVVLEDIENPTNVGAIFRSAAGLMADAVLLTGLSSDPLYRRASRVSMGTVFQLPWTIVDRADPAAFRAAGFLTAAMALTEDSITLRDPVLKGEQPLVLFFGNESTGLSEETLRAVDHVVRIPMANGVDSLNVAAASAVAFWELFHV